MKNIAISRRYAKALMLIGKEDGNAEKYRKELGSLVELMNSVADLDKTVNNPLYDVDSRRKVLDAVVKQMKLSKIVKAFTLLLFDKGRFSFLDSIYDFYQKLADELKGIAHAKVTSAVKIPKESADKIQKSLSDLTGKKVMLDVEQDPDLIGGIVTKIGDLVLDGSIRTQLENMRESFKRGESV